MTPLGQKILDTRAVLDAIKPFCDDAPAYESLTAMGLTAAQGNALRARAAVMVPCWQRTLDRFIALCAEYDGEGGP